MAHKTIMKDSSILTSEKVALSFFSRLGFRAKIITAFVFISILVIGGVGLAVNRVVQTELVNQVGSNLESLARAQSLTLGAEFSKQIHLLDAISRDLSVKAAVIGANNKYQGSPAEIHKEIHRLDQQWRDADVVGDDSHPLIQSVLLNPSADLLRSFRMTNPDHVEVFVTDIQGLNVAATNRTSDYFQADEDWWHSAFRNDAGSIFISEPQFDFSSRTYAVVIALPIIDDSTGQIVGILRSTYGVSGFATFLASVKFGETGESSLIFRSGEVLKDTMERAVLDPQTLSRLQVGQNNFDEFIYDEKLRIVSHTPLTSIDTELGDSINNLGWTLVVTQDPAEALLPGDVARSSTWIITLTALLLGSLLAAFSTRYLLGPITRLTSVAEQVGAGNLEIQAPIESSDEIGVLAETFNKTVRRLRDLQAGLEGEVNQRTSQLQATIQVGQVINSILEPDEVIGKVTALITDRFHHYYSAIFIVDSSGRWAELKGATGEAGRVLRESGHKLEVGGNSMVGSAIRFREARVALDVGAESVRFENPLLPYTRSEIALPLIVGDKVLGALDVQSTNRAAFGEQDIATLQSMANQVAIALENARLYQETHQRLQELQTAQRQYLRESWSSVGSTESLEYGLGEPSTNPQGNAFHVPLTLRNEIIGQITMESDGEWTAEEHSWVDAVATQAAIALENARLLDASQKYATSEKIIAEISGKIWSSRTIEGILQTSVRELGRTFNAAEVTFQLDLEDSESNG